MKTLDIFLKFGLEFPVIAYNCPLTGKSDSSTSEPDPLTRAHLSADRPTYRKDCTPNDRPDILPLRVSPQNAKPYCFGVATRAGICGVR